MVAKSPITSATVERGHYVVMDDCSSVIMENLSEQAAIDMAKKLVEEDQDTYHVLMVVAKLEPKTICEVTYV